MSEHGTRTWYCNSTGGWGASPTDAVARVTVQTTAQTRTVAYAETWGPDTARWRPATGDAADAVLPPAALGHVVWVAPTAREGRKLLAVRALRPLPDAVAAQVAGVARVDDALRPVDDGRLVWHVHAADAAEYVAALREGGCEVLPDGDPAQDVHDAEAVVRGALSTLRTCAHADTADVAAAQGGETMRCVDVVDRGAEVYDAQRVAADALAVWADIAGRWAAPGRSGDEQTQAAVWHHAITQLRDELALHRDHRARAEVDAACAAAGLLPRTALSPDAQVLVWQQAADLLIENGHAGADGAVAVDVAGGQLCFVPASPD